MPDDRAAFLRGAIEALEAQRTLFSLITDDGIRTILQNWLKETLASYRRELATIPPPAAGPGWELVEECRKAFRRISEGRGYMCYSHTGDEHPEDSAHDGCAVSIADAALAKIAAVRKGAIDG